MPTPPLQEKKSVQQLLEALQVKGGVGPLRELIAYLNYDPLNEVVSRSNWLEPAKMALASDPRLYGRAAGDFYVVYAQLSTDKLKLTEERAVIPQLLKEYPYALFVFSDISQKDFHFVNVKWESTQKRRLYRRIAVGPQERLRTAVERITMLDPQIINAGLFGVTAQQIQDAHDRAFDVSRVTKDFYEDYKRVFETVRDSVKGFGSTPEELDRRHLFAQRLFNRLMFLRFIQKKGWLAIDGSTDYLAALWASHSKTKQDGKNFYADRLRLLFQSLNDERAGILLQGGGGTVEATIGKVKYLNGGLFEETAEDKDANVRIADAPFKQIFDQAEGLFERFNFTITESTPLDIEIAVDPEMLGKIFEELVTGRHDSGSYYTPKPIVSFMCREALKGYLETHVPGEKRKVLARFVDKHEPEDVHDAEAVLNALRRVTVCDPACGSGAYLLGMMHELLDLRQCLFQTRQVDNKTMYQRKLDIIQTNIYGVDNAEFAVNIARLRLWLSLAVDYDGPEPQPLPNLDYKIEVGDSICSPSPGALQMGVQQPIIDEFLRVKSRYLMAHHSEKQTLRAKVEALRHDIQLFSHRDAEMFDWVIHFAEVFTAGGFDVVIANPPYVRQELIIPIKSALKRLYPTTYDGRADLYCFFYARGLELLSKGGSIAIISSNKWLHSKYGIKLRAEIALRCHVKSITDFGELPIFEAAATFPMILVAQEKSSPSVRTRYTSVRSLDPPYPDVDAVIASDGSDLEPSAISTSDWVLANQADYSLVQGLRAAGKPLSEYAPLGIYSGIKSGLNDAFWIDQATKDRLIKEDPGSAEVIKPLARGDDVRKWHIRDNGLHIIYTHQDVDLKRYPAIKKHLTPFRRQLEERAGGQEWWQLQQSQYRNGVWDEPKIVYPYICSESRFTLDRSGIHANMNAFIIPCNDLYLLGVLSSSVVWEYLKHVCAVLGDAGAGGRLLLKMEFMKDVPIPHASDMQRKSVAKIVKRCLSNPDDCEDAQKELDQLIEGLYFLGNG